MIVATACAPWESALTDACAETWVCHTGKMVSMTHVSYVCIQRDMQRPHLTEPANAICHHYPCRNSLFISSSGGPWRPSEIIQGISSTNIALILVFRWSGFGIQWPNGAGCSYWRMVKQSRKYFREQIDYLFSSESLNDIMSNAWHACQGYSQILFGFLWLAWGSSRKPREDQRNSQLGGPGHLHISLVFLISPALPCVPWNFLQEAGETWTNSLQWFPRSSRTNPI